MRLREPATTLLLLIGALASAQPANGPDEVCPVTPGGQFGNEALSTVLWDGPVVFRPDGPGFVDYDGALGMKWPFVRHIPGRLAIGGQRLDDEAPPARAYLNDGYGRSGFQPAYLVFPTPGCWEITAGASGNSLTFVVLVELIGDGPDWRFNGVPEHWHATTRWDEFVSEDQADPQP
jgi:hypothetical protein